MAKTNDTSGADVKKQLHETLDELEGLRDTVRVRMHLAGMELKQKWDKLDTRFLALRDEVKSATKEARVELSEAARDGLVEVKKGLREVREALDAKPS